MLGSSVPATVIVVRCLLLCLRVSQKNVRVLSSRVEQVEGPVGRISRTVFVYVSRTSPSFMSHKHLGLRPPPLTVFNLSYSVFSDRPGLGYSRTSEETSRLTGLMSQTKKIYKDKQTKTCLIRLGTGVFRYGRRDVPLWLLPQYVGPSVQCGIQGVRIQMVGRFGSLYILITFTSFKFLPLNVQKNRGLTCVN